MSSRTLQCKMHQARRGEPCPGSFKMPDRAPSCLLPRSHSSPLQSERALQTGGPNYESSKL